MGRRPDALRLRLARARRLIRNAAHHDFRLHTRDSRMPGELLQEMFVELSATLGLDDLIDRLKRHIVRKPSIGGGATNATDLGPPHPRQQIDVIEAGRLSKACNK